MAPLSQKLREATAAAHASIERALGIDSETFTRTSYLNLIARWYGLLTPWECQTGMYIQPEVMAPRQKTPHLIRDLRYFGVDAATVPLVPRDQQLPCNSASDAAGSFYMVEGSTLGAQFISAHFAKHLGITPDCGGRFFAGYGNATKQRWVESRQMLDEFPAHEHDAVIQAANEAFARTQQWLMSNQP